MDITGIQIGLDVLISVLFGAAGAVGVWFKLKGKVDIQSVQIESNEQEIEKLRTAKKEINATIHKRIDTLKDTVEKNRERSDNNVEDIKREMNKMELRIINAIYENKK